jgi:hypothetical protein
MNAAEVLDALIDDDAWRQMLGSLALGRQAVATIYDDLRTLKPRRHHPLYDDDVQALVTFKPSPDEDRTATAVLPLADVWRLEQVDGNFITDVQPAMDSIALLALARAGDAGVISMVDYRGAGALALSSAPPEAVGLNTVRHKTVGAFVRSWEQQSGVKHVNDRREQAAAEIYRQWPKAEWKFKHDLVNDIITAEIFAHYRDLPCGPGYAWQVIERGVEMIDFDVTPVEIKRVADRIVDALALVAYETKRPRALGSRLRQLSWEDEHENVFDAKTGRRLPGVMTYYGGDDDKYERWANEIERANNLGRIQMIGNFNLRHLRPDFVGDLAAELADGTGGLAQYWALYSSRFEELVDYWGLVPREAGMLVLAVREQLSVSEIADRYGTDPRIVAEILERARQKCTRPPLAPAVHPSVTRAIEAAHTTESDFVTVS